MSPGAQRGPRWLGACPAHGQGGATRSACNGRQVLRPQDGGSDRLPATSPRQWLLFQDFSGDGKIAVRVEQVARAGVALLVVAEVDLAKARVDARVRRGAHRLLQTGAGVGACCVTTRLASDVERPRPRDDASIASDAALLQGYGVEHRRGDACALCGKLVSRWRKLLGMGGAGAQARRDHQCAQALRNGGGHYGWRCH